MRVDVDIATGTTDRHVVRWINEGLDEPHKHFLVHSGLVEPFRQLRDRAASKGYDLCVCSGFRSFQRQAEIWNAKVSGHRPTLDHESRPMSLDGLTDWQKAEAVLRWSALPGASRHHWGTDLDVYDAAAMPSGYQLQLTPEETDRGGMFAPMHDWLDTQMDINNGFFRPYHSDTGGIAPERWHLSYAPLARHFEAVLTPQLLAERLHDQKIYLSDTLIGHLPVIYERFIRRR